MLSPPTSTTSSMMKSDYSPPANHVMGSYPSSPSNDMSLANVRQHELYLDALHGGDIPNDPGLVAGKMFIGGLSWQTTPESIREYFSCFGELAEVMVMKDPATRRSRGFGFITFSDPSAVEKVLSCPVHQLDGKVVEPKVAVPRKTNPGLVMRTKKIFVGGLSATTSLEDVRAYFEQFSKVRDAMLAYDKVTNRHRGFGFVTFDNDEVVDKICEIHFHEINGKMVESKKAMPKEPRGPGGGMGGAQYFSQNYFNGYSQAANGSFSPASRQQAPYGFKNGHFDGYLSDPSTNRSSNNHFFGREQSNDRHFGHEFEGRNCGFNIFADRNNDPAMDSADFPPLNFSKKPSSSGLMSF